VDLTYAGLNPYDLNTGLNRAANRLQSPNLGRWLSPDPLGGEITNPQSLNRYTYVLNAPTTLIDPSGLCSRSKRTQFSCPNGGFNLGAYVNGFLFSPGADQLAFWGSNWYALSGQSNPGAEAEAGYLSNFVWQFRGSLYGQHYSQTFPTLQAYFDWRTGIASLPQSQIYSAFVKLGLYLEGFDPTLQYEVHYQERGTTFNVQVIGANGQPLALNSDAAGADASFMGTGHGGNDSYYIGGMFDVLHVVNVVNPYASATPGGEGHIDPESPYGVGAPIHALEYGLSLFLIRQRGSLTCSVIGGCH
jgi:RHS repeat-associated protein